MYDFAARCQSYYTDKVYAGLEVDQASDAYTAKNMAGCYRTSIASSACNEVVFHCYAWSCHTSQPTEEPISKSDFSCRISLWDSASNAFSQDPMTRIQTYLPFTLFLTLLLSAVVQRLVRTIRGGRKLQRKARLEQNSDEKGRERLWKSYRLSSKQVVVRYISGV